MNNEHYHGGVTTTTTTTTNVQLGIGRRRRQQAQHQPAFRTTISNVVSQSQQEEYPPLSPALSKAELSRASTAKINNLHTGPIDLDDEVSVSSSSSSSSSEDEENNTPSRRCRRPPHPQQRQRTHQHHRQRGPPRGDGTTSNKQQSSLPSAAPTVTRLHLDNITNKSSLNLESMTTPATTSNSDNNKEKSKTTGSLLKKAGAKLIQTLTNTTSGGSKDEGDHSPDDDDLHTIGTSGAIVSESEIQDLQQPKALKLTSSNLYGHDTIFEHGGVQQQVPQQRKKKQGVVHHGSSISQYNHKKTKSPNKKSSSSSNHNHRYHHYDRNGHLQPHATTKSDVMMERWRYEQHQHTASRQQRQTQQAQVVEDSDITPLRHTNTTIKNDVVVQPIPLRHSLKDAAGPSNVFQPVVSGSKNAQQQTTQQQHQPRRNSESLTRKHRTTRRQRHAQPLSKSVPSNSNLGTLSMIPLTSSSMKEDEKPESSGSMIPLESLSMKEAFVVQPTHEETALRTCLSEPLQHRQNTFDECSSASDDEFDTNGWVAFKSDPLFLKTQDVQSVSGTGTEIMLPYQDGRAAEC